MRCGTSGRDRNLLLRQIIVDEVLLRQLKALYQECELTLYNQTPKSAAPQDEQQTIDAPKEMYRPDSDEDAGDDE